VASLYGLCREQFLAGAQQSLWPAKTEDSTSLKSYNAAIRLFSRDLKKGSVGVDSVICCLIFILFELQRDNHLAAFRHHQGFQAVIQEVKKQDCSTISEATALLAFDRLALRMENQAMLFIGSKVPNFCTDFCVSDSFNSLVEARDALDQRKTRTLEFLNPYAYVNPEYCPPWSTFEGRSHNHFHVFHGTFKGYILPDLDARRHELLDTLQLWKDRFDSFLQQEDHHGRAIDVKSLSLLRMTYWVEYIRVSTAHSDDEMIYDFFLPIFKSILGEAQHILDISNREQTDLVPSHILPADVLLGSGLVYCLYFTCLKCREPHVRDNALLLLSQAGRDGIWDGAMLAQIAKHVIQLESPIEEGSGTTEEPVGICLRVNGISLDIDKENSKVWVRTVQSTKAHEYKRSTWRTQDAILRLDL
jgi:hypothetical protein